MTKKQSVYIRLEPEYIQKIDQLAKKDDRSRSYTIRKIIIDALK